MGRGANRDVNQERVWVEQARRGDMGAFTRLVESYQAPVYNLCYRMLGNAAEAEDAAQETFLRAYTRLHTYDPRRPFSTWLLSIASHYCIDCLRRRRVTWVPLEDLGDGQWTSGSLPAPEEALIQEEARDEVQRLIDRLPPPDRAVVVLRYWYDLSLREIAQVMGTTESAVKSRLFRARRALAQAVRRGDCPYLQPAGGAIG